MDDSIMDGILRLYQKEYNIMSELYRMTTELEQVMGTGDRLSIQLVLDMREEAIGRLADNRRNISILEDALAMQARHYLRRLLKADQEAAPRDESERKLCLISGDIRDIKERILMLDRKISLKTAGNDSYYKKREEDTQ